ncbi:MAG TPA: type II toxin-antitoxin system VapC family toxin [Myxococcota bacterium]|nr:type II toxin-antitoxin system VapC family toxin [Myxococcota bacterium]
MRLLLDTNAWLFLAVGSDRLSPEAKRQVTDPSCELFLSTCSLWEFMVLHRKGRFSVDRPPVHWAQASISALGVKLLSIDADIAFQSELLQDFHGDPADRFVVATGIVHGVPLVTSDAKIHAWKGIPVVW